MRRKLTDAEKLSILVKEHLKFAIAHRYIAKTNVELIIELKKQMQKENSLQSGMLRPYKPGIVCREVKKHLKQYLNIHAN